MRRARLDVFLLALLAVLLIAPLFRVEYLDNWPSIESTFIADARMLRNHLPHPGWQPMWYAGTRFDYIYPPALRYGTALISLAAGISTARAYHLYTASFYVLGILAVWWLVYVGSGSRRQAWLAGAAAALVSPSVLLLTRIRVDNGLWLPQRLWVLVHYGEGPHITSLGLLPAALAASLLALRGPRPRWMAGAAFLCALVVSNNFYGAVALALFFPILVWSVFVTHRAQAVWGRALGIALLAWGLCAFWLTPSYLRITMLNLHTVAEPGNLSSVLAGLLAVAIFAAASWRWGRSRPHRQWPVFAAGAAALLAFDVIGAWYFHLRIAGNTERLVPEFDLVLIVAAVAASAALWSRPAARIAAVAVMAGLFAPAWIYLQHPWQVFAAAGDLNGQYVYQVAKWVENNLPGARVLPVGMVRFWLDAWADNAQLDGGSQQGLLNREYPVGGWQLLVGEGGEVGRMWLQAMGTDAVIVPAPGSREAYLDLKFPEKFRGVLPELWDDGQKTTLYRVPRVHPGIGRVIDSAALAAVPAITGGLDENGLQAYLAQVERPDLPEVRVGWKGFDEALVTATTGAGQAVLLQETFDSAWHAYENGRELPVRRDGAMDFMVVDPGTGEHTFQMRFETPLENRAGQGIFILSAVLCLWLVRKQPATDR